MECQVEKAQPHQMVWNLEIKKNHNLKLNFKLSSLIKHASAKRPWLLTANFNKRSVIFVISIVEKGVREFLTEGIIHCWNKDITT